ncbi:MAG: hypothetical protein E7330_05110 [Clostridiales bacterium]|nr:hypothetical protein [Clostridiales bacterium]
MINETEPAMRRHAEHSRTGWQDGEEAFLFSEVAKKRAAGEPLRAAFEQVAMETGRKPNSIRNYYYAKVRETGAAGENGPQGAAFVPFGEEETRALLKTVLTARAKGVSVRACTLTMGGGDTKTMLRYQNKYRSLLRTNPALVREVMGELRETGLPVPDPYAAKARRGPLRQEAVPSLAEATAQALGAVQGVDAAAFFRTLAALAAAAKAHETDCGPGRCVQLREYIALQEEAQSAERAQFQKLAALLREMTALCRSFLSAADEKSVPAFGGYFDALSENVADCERMLSMIS